MAKTLLLPLALALVAAMAFFAGSQTEVLRGTTTTEQFINLMETNIVHKSSGAPCVLTDGTATTADDCGECGGLGSLAKCGSDCSAKPSVPYTGDDVVKHTWAGKTMTCYEKCNSACGDGDMNLCMACAVELSDNGLSCAPCMACHVNIEMSMQDTADIMSCGATIVAYTDSYTSTWTDHTNRVFKAGAPSPGDNVGHVLGSGAVTKLPTITPSKFSLLAAVYPFGSTNIKFAAIDHAGNIAECVQTVEVLDKLKPQCTCPSGTASVSEPGKCGGVVTWDKVTCSDNVTPQESLTYEYTGLGSDSFFPVGTTKVGLKAFDASGNFAECNFEVTIADTEAPTIQCASAGSPFFLSPDTLASCPAKVEGTVACKVMDNCPGATHQCAVGTTIGQVSDDGSSSFTFPYRPSFADADAAPVTTVLCTATDAAEKKAEATVEVAVIDNTPPVLFVSGAAAGTKCQPDITVAHRVDSTAGPHMVSLTANDGWKVPTCEDNGCGCGVRESKGRTFGHMFFPGVHTLEYIATDNTGKTDVCTTTVTIKADNTEPQIMEGSCPKSFAMIIEGDGGTHAVAHWAAPIFTDVSGVDVVSSLPAGAASPLAFPVGITEVKYTATDRSVNRNKAVCQFTVTVDDLERPTLLTLPGMVCNDDTKPAVGEPCGGQWLESTAFTTASKTNTAVALQKPLVDQECCNPGYECRGFSSSLKVCQLKSREPALLEIIAIKSSSASCDGCYQKKFPGCDPRGPERLISGCSGTTCKTVWGCGGSCDAGVLQVNGNGQGEWCSRGGSGKSAGGQWLDLDLGSEKTVTSLRIWGGVSGKRFPQTLSVLTGGKMGDSTNGGVGCFDKNKAVQATSGGWTTISGPVVIGEGTTLRSCAAARQASKVGQQTDGDACAISLTTHVKARYVRLHMEGTAGNDNYMELRKVEVTGF